MVELTDSSGIAGDFAALRARLREDGYVFVRGLLDADAVAAVGRAGRRFLQEAGWLEPGVDPDAARIRPPAHPSDPSHGWKEPGYRAFASSPAFNQLPYLAPLRRFMGLVMGAGAFSYPVKVAGVVYPEAYVAAHGGRYVHRDYAVVGVQDMFTTWIPLGHIPVELGGLAVAPGSPSRPWRRPHLLDPGAPGWATADYRPGDVLAFHCCTEHAALPNTTADRLRISGEARWQLAEDPVPARVIYGPNNDGVELFSRLFRRAPWWQPVPPGLRIVASMERPAGEPVPASRYVDLAPGLAAPGAVGGPRPH